MKILSSPQPGRGFHHDLHSLSPTGGEGQGEGATEAEPCCDEVLWAFNLRHLDLLGRLVGAFVRERERAARARGDAVSNATLLARLPRWMKAAKNRDAVLACIQRLRGRAAMGRRAGKPRN